jgi:hypothetical protein
MTEARNPEQASHVVLVNQGHRVGVFPIQRTVWDINTRSWEVTIEADPAQSYDEAKLALSARPRKLFTATKPFQVVRNKAARRA